MNVLPPPPPPEVVVNYKPLVAAVFAIVLAVVGLWSSKRRPWEGGTGRKAVAKAFTFTSILFVLAETGTGVFSLLTGQLSIPPLFGVGTVVDMTILIVGLAVALIRVMKTKR